MIGLCNICGEDRDDLDSWGVCDDCRMEEYCELS